MYVREYKELDSFWGAVCYRDESELIEADGEAEQLFLEQVVAEQYPSQYFQTIDWVSHEVINLDITDYIKQDTYDLFESVILNTSEDEELSFTKVNSFYLACKEAKR